MRLLLIFARAHPRRSLITLLCLLLASLAEGIGLSSLLPLLGLAVPAAGADAAARTGAGETGLEATVHDILLGLGLEPTAGLLLGFIAGGILAKAALVLLANRQVGYTVAHVATDLRRRLVRALMGARWGYYTRQPAGAIANAFATEAERAAQAYFRGAMIVAAGIQTLVYTGIALLVSWRATLAALGLAVLTVYALSRLIRVARRAGVRQTHLLRSALGRLADALHVAKPLKAMAREERMGALLEREARRLDRSIRGEVLSKEALKALQEPIVAIPLVGGLFVALSYWMLPLPTLTLLGLLFYRTLGATNKMQREYQALAVRESAYWSLSDAIERAEAEAEAEGSGNGVAPTLEREIALRGVSLAYDGQPVLREASLSFPAGKITSLIGMSGAGKTSIADLLIGLVRPQQGAVFIDDVPLRDVDLRRWRRRIGYVPQEICLLNDSVLANVTLGGEDVTQADAEAALASAGAGGFVSELLDGIHTTVGEHGSRLSGGQRQRIAIARALVHRPDLLILDEATTALDPETEAAICATVTALRGAMTIIAISHQRALVDLADRVYRVEDGIAKLV